MRILLSAGFRLTAFASLHFWWIWFMSGAVYYYAAEGASLWASFTSGAGIALVISVVGAFSSLMSEAFEVSS